MEKELKHADVFRLLEKLAPKDLAYDWDNVGLQVGSDKHLVKKIMVTLDVLEPVVDEAINKEVNLIIAHHPMLFKPLNQIHVESPQGRMVSKLLKHDITVYAAHTNYDLAEGGMNDILCEKLNIQPTHHVREYRVQSLYKLVCFVPLSHAEKVRDAMGNSGAGHIGNYSHCTFQSQGQGTFKPLEGTNPYIGTQNQLEFVDEVRMETIVEEENLNKVVQAMINAHPYEEVAYDIYPLENKGKKYGLGRIGTLAKPVTLREFAVHVKNKLDIPYARVTGDLEAQIRKVAILGGSGEKYIHAAKQKGADVYITGDMTFHAAQDAWQMGLAVIDAGHYIEKAMKESVKRYLENNLDDNVEIIVSETNTDPFQFI
ncbi:GTP cyclohydrolase 1 type 2 [Compostibacillus humi]|uniref:GTP cyclohydrolase 1 type 2 homolog n=1 Tax=Compostibacillus humi TaxID=1245525 RepID=A0A8J2TQ71_9BACI|nr:Nif3-like dinuclear metal center hexameric protein [Compostibacillus humi]GFZ81803.1 GTP cyclohydrolase 1 type 2 [Compostibacillus humi]